ncbi:MAG TPA: hypothetical protein VF337_03525 [Candidatus Limnocylindrales bacterium]
MTPERARLLEALAELILAVDRPHPVRVAVDGPDAAGKTILADELAPILGGSGRPIVRASIDGFHRPRRERLARGPESPEGYYRDSFDYAGLRTELLDPLGPNGNRVFLRRIFDYRQDEPAVAPTETAAIDSILLFDGVFLQRPELAGLWDFTIFVSVPFAETRRRAAVRDAILFGPSEAGEHRYAVRYVPGQEMYFDEVHPDYCADVVVLNENPDRPEVRLHPPLDS